MNKTLLESQEGVLYFTSLALSMISAISSVALHSVQNPQTLQRFLSPLYLMISKKWLFLCLFRVSVTQLFMNIPELVNIPSSTCKALIAPLRQFHARPWTQVAPCVLTAIEVKVRHNMMQINYKLTVSIACFFATVLNVPPMPPLLSCKPSFMRCLI